MAHPGSSFAKSPLAPGGTEDFLVSPSVITELPDPAKEEGTEKQLWHEETSPYLARTCLSMAQGSPNVRGKRQELTAGLPRRSPNLALTPLHFRGRKRSGAFDVVWPSANINPQAIYSVCGAGLPGLGWAGLSGHRQQLKTPLATASS